MVHVSFGLASAVRRSTCTRRRGRRSSFPPAASSSKAGSATADPGGQVTFDIYKGSQFEPGDKSPLVQGVTTGNVVIVPEGAYYIVSNYGDTNAVVRSDIRVQAGKLTDVTVNHRAAVHHAQAGERGRRRSPRQYQLVGPSPPAATSSRNSTGAFPRVVLAEGDYRAIARSDGRTYERNFKVITGVDGEVEVLAR